MSGTAFTYPLAKRIVSSTKWTEEQRGIIPDIESPSYFNENQQLLVRTNSTLPSGYTGTMAVQGEIVDQNQDGTYSKKMPVWIRDQNGGTLSANTIYQGITAGTYTQNITTNGITVSTTLGLYLVQVSSLPDEPHYYPAAVHLSEFNRYNDPANPSMSYYDIGNGGVLPIHSMLRFSNAVSNNYRVGLLNPILKLKKTKTSVKLFGTTDYPIFSFYSDPIIVGKAVQISYGKAISPYGTPYDITVFDPTYTAYGGIPIFSTTGYYLCQWQMVQFYGQYVSASDPYILDFLTVISKVPTTTTNGIGSGIGSGISGV
jgi:hypothetical protein